MFSYYFLNIFFKKIYWDYVLKIFNFFLYFKWIFSMFFLLFKKKIWNFFLKHINYIAKGIVSSAPCRIQHPYGSYTMQYPRLFWVLYSTTGLEGRLAICLTHASPSLFSRRSKKRLIAKGSLSHPGSENNWEQSGERVCKAWESVEQFRPFGSCTYQNPIGFCVLHRQDP